MPDKTVTTFDRISISAITGSWVWAVYANGMKHTGMTETFAQAQENISKIIKPMEPKNVQV